jgi:hypothetical protein
MPGRSPTGGSTLPVVMTIAHPRFPGFPLVRGQHLERRPNRLDLLDGSEDGKVTRDARGERSEGDGGDTLLALIGRRAVTL